jgi:hypothetical protein
MSEKCVWVLEVGVLNAKGDRVSSWGIWQAYTTRGEAVAARDEQTGGRIRESLQFLRATRRVVKYVPKEAPRG